MTRNEMAETIRRNYYAGRWNLLNAVCDAVGKQVTQMEEEKRREARSFGALQIMSLGELALAEELIREEF